MSTWVHFWDMHSGGRQKLAWSNIFIEAADRGDAVRYFEQRFGRDPNNVTCECCGEDYSINDEGPSLKQATGFQRNCSCIEAKRDEVTGLYKNDDPVLLNSYLDPGEEPPPGYNLSSLKPWREWVSLEDFSKLPHILIVRLEDR